MRKGMWGAIAGVTAGAGGAWGQSPAADPPPPAAVAPAGDIVPVQDFGPVPPGTGLPPGFGAQGGLRGLPPSIMPPMAPGPAGDPQGFGPVGGFGPPPGPMYPPPGPYGAPMFQPPPGNGGAEGSGAGAAPRFWMTYEYLLWYSKSQGYPFPLLTTSAPTDLGLLNRASTLVLAGSGMNASVGPLSGGRITAGFFADADRRYGFEASGFVTEQRANIVDVASSPSGIPLLARPFRDSATPGAISTLVVAAPGLGQGHVVVLNGQQTYSVEANGVVNLYRSEPGSKGCSLDALAGYRYLELNEVFSETSYTTLNLAPTTVIPNATVGPFGQVTVAGATVVPGTMNVGGITVASGSVITIVDEIRTRNQFNGFQSGLRGEVRHGMFSLAASGKVGVGYMRQTVDVSGYTNIDPLVRASSRTFGGVYANSATIGRFTNDEFAIVPEINLTLGVAVTRNMTMHLGYNFLYVDHVARPATELTTVVNSSTIPFSPNYGAGGRPLVRPVQFNQDDFWLQGLTTGFTVRF